MLLFADLVTDAVWALHLLWHPTVSPLGKGRRVPSKARVATMQGKK